MSHAACLVITDQEPTAAVLGRILQPWHEFECTGTDDQYVKDIDETVKLREEFASHQKRMIRIEDGSLVDAYDDRFYREPTQEEVAKIGAFAGTGGGHGMSWASRDWGDGRGYRTRVLYVPEGCSDVEVPTGTVMTFREFVSDYQGRPVLKHNCGPDLRKKHKYGYALLGPDAEVVRVVNRTNPTKKWDWWVVGGRYADRLHDLSGRTLDICRRDQINLDAMRAKQIKNREEWADECAIKAKGDRAGLDIACRAKHHVDAVWRELPEPRPRGQEFYAWIEARGSEHHIYAQYARPNWELPPVPHNRSLQEWIDAAPPLSSWAVVMDDQWFEKGQMGWWGTSSGDQGDWDEKFDDLFGLVRPDQWLAVVDYHI